MTRDVCRRMGLLPVLLVACSLAVSALPLEAGEKEEAKGAEGRQAFAGMTVSVDPETGRVRPPSAEQARKLREAMRGIVARLRAERQARAGAQAAAQAEGAAQPENGRRSAVVGPDHLNFTMATVGADGEVSTLCLNTDHDHDQEPDAAAPAAK